MANHERSPMKETDQPYPENPNGHSAAALHSC